MADDIINSGNTGTQKTVTQRMQEYADTDSKLRADHAAASEVMNSAMAELEHGRQQNTEFTNSGLNTTVAKDANGNAIGTYDWDAQAEHNAKIAYNSDVLSAKQDATATKQELVTNQQQGQTQHDMASYSANQSAEKAGWTGGYILDSNRQVAFLKESIKANLYSQEELQKYGYDTALAAARANYDLKKSELAMQYYNTAVQNAFQMAEFTGKFVSPETSFHLSQRGVAEQILSDPTATEADKLKAQDVISSVNSWFKGNDISEEGVYCISVLMQNWTQAASVVDSIGNFIVNNADAWDKFNTMVASNQQAATTANEDAQRTGMFSYVDEYGNTQKVSANWTTAMVDGTMPEGFDKWSSTTKAEYKSILGNVIASDLKNKIETDANISGKNFADEASAKDAIKNAIVDNIAKYSASENISDVNIAGINIEVTINGTKMSIPVPTDSMTNYKNYKKSETTPKTIEPIEDKGDDISNLGTLSNEKMADEAKEYIWSGDNIVASGNKKINAGGNIKLTINGTKQDTKYEYDKDYGETTTEILKVFFPSDTTSERYIGTQAILLAMSNDSYAVISVPAGNGSKYAVIVKDKEGHYSFLRDKSASTKGSSEVATSETIQNLAKVIRATRTQRSKKTNM